LVESEGQAWQRVSEHLDRVLELSPSQCADYLAALEREDSTVAALLREMLAARGQSSFAQFLCGPMPRIPDAAPAGGLVGRRVGSYLIDAEIGRGGMGSVWRASRADGRFEAYVAIKFVHLSWLGEDGERRFKLEGRLLARLSHPSIARLIDAGVLDGTHPYIVIEYVDGSPIDVYCERLALGIEDRIRLFLEVLAAVAHAHSQLIVHRDLKPSNVLVTRGGAIKLLDFGIAKLLEEPGGSADHTLASEAALTPQYAAPEQLLGQPVTTATDVYTLGLMLYFLLTGVHPLSPTARSRVELIQTILTTDPPRPSLVAAGPAAWRRTLAGDLDNILGKALRKSPSERYLSVGALAEDLRRFLAHEPVQARPATAGYRVARFVRRNRAAVVSGVAVVCGLLALSIFALLQMIAARTQRDLAVYQVKLANAQSDITAFIVSDPVGRASPDVVRQRLDRARQFIATHFRGDPLLEGRMLFDVSARYIDIGENQIAAEIIQEAEAIGRRVGDPEYVAELACIRTQDLAIARDLPAARTQLATGLANMRLVGNVQPSLIGECASGSAFVAQADGDFARAVTLLQEALLALERAGMKGKGRYTSTTNDLARAYSQAGDFHGAWEVESRNLAVLRDAGRADTDSYLAFVSVSCSALRNGGQPRRALELLESTETEARKTASDFAPPYYLVGCRALNQIALGRSEEAHAGLVQATAEAEKAGNPYHLSSYRVGAVTLSLDRGDLEGADAAWTELVPEESAALAAHDKGEGAVRLILTHARLDLAHGRVGDALHRLETAAALVAARRQPSNPDAREVELLQSQAFMANQAYPRAEEHARNAVAFARAAAVDSRSSAWIGEALVWLARSEAALGNKKAAAESAREAVPQLEANLDPSHPLIAAARAMAQDAL
jgi:serine/threonine-protein kinase